MRSPKVKKFLRSPQNWEGADRFSKKGSFSDKKLGCLVLAAPGGEGMRQIRFRCRYSCSACRALQEYENQILIASLSGPPWSRKQKVWKKFLPLGAPALGGHPDHWWTCYWYLSKGLDVPFLKINSPIQSDHALPRYRPKCNFYFFQWEITCDFLPEIYAFKFRMLNSYWKMGVVQSLANISRTCLSFENRFKPFYRSFKYGQIDTLNSSLRLPGREGEPPKH